MNRNLVKEHIKKHFVNTYDKKNSYLKLIEEYVEFALEGSELTLHHIHINDYLTEDQQAIILDELIDIFHAYYSLHVEEKSHFNKLSILESIAFKLRVSRKTLVNPTTQMLKRNVVEKKYLRKKKAAVDSVFESNNAIIPMTIINLNKSTIDNFSKRAVSEKIELFNHR